MYFTDFLKQVEKHMDKNNIPQKNSYLNIPPTCISSNMLISINDRSTIQYLKLLFENKKFSYFEPFIEFRKEKMCTYILQD